MLSSDSTYYDVTLEVEDTTPPVIKNRQVEISQDFNRSLTDLFNIQDYSSFQVNLDVSNLDMNNPGTYNVEVDAIDEYYNETKEYCTVVVSSSSTNQSASEVVQDSQPVSQDNTDVSVSDYNGNAYSVINDNDPGFTDYEITEATVSYQYYSPLDNLGRCQYAKASIAQDIMPTTKRKSISSVTPSGWMNKQYANVSGGWLYNRCHLIGYQLTGQNANSRNLITGTRYLNIEGMLPFENEVANYIKRTNDHVLYEVIPIYEGNNLVASGVNMKACSVSDHCQSIRYNIYAYNVQPGINIDYSTGDNW